MEWLVMKWLWLAGFEGMTTYLVILPAPARSG
jgi:hypothetical protein